MDSDLLGFAGRIVLALVLGGAIGLEREIDGHPAGFRTHITVALGAALFGIISVDGFDRFVTSQPTNVEVDVTRVASQVVVGIGFLGAGTIVKNRGAVRGLTTAASLWVAAAVGLGVGMAVYGPSVLTTAAVLLALVALRAPQRWILGVLSTRRHAVSISLAGDADVGALVSALHNLDKVTVRSLSVRTVDGDRAVHVDLKPLPGADIDRILAELTDRPDVHGVEVT